MKVNEVCVRKKQVRPGVYKALCDGYIRMRAGVYRVPVGTIIVPENDLLIVKTKHGSVCWRYELHRNWWGDMSCIVTGGLVECCRKSIVQ